MICENVIGNLSYEEVAARFAGYEVDPVDFDWHEAFGKLHRKESRGGRTIGVRLGDWVLSHGLREGDVLGVDEREFARFGDAECRIGKFVPLCGGEAVVRFGLCRHGCCSIGVVAGIRKFPASHRFFAQRLLRCPMCFAR